MERYSQITRYVTETFVIFLFAAVLILQTINIFFRYTGFLAPMMWVEEFSTFSFIWMFFLLWHVADRDGKHFVVDMLHGKASPAMVRGLEIFTHFAAIVFSGVVVWSSWAWISAAGGYPTNSFKWLLMGVVYLVIPLGLGLVLIERISMLLAVLRRSDS